MIERSWKGFLPIRGLASIAFLLISWGAFATPPSSQETEFPNYFAELPPQVAQEKINKALDQVLRKLQIPYVDDDGKLRNDGFYLKLNERISQEDSKAQAYVSGGVVRSLLGYIYKKVYSAKKKDPHANVGQILDKIGNRDKDIPLLSAMGVGSDLDILLDSKNHSPHLKERATQFINSAESKLDLRGSASKFKYALVAIGDVKDYHEQIGRTTAQGGSSLDWLAFPLPRKDGHVGSMREPEGSYHITETFLKGEYDYLPSNGKSEDTDKQTVRGLRPLLEMPFLRLTPSGHQQMVRELTVLKDKVSRGEILSSGALEQFGKLTRNARFEGGHNRFHISENELEKTALEISNLSAKGEKRLPLIPEFLERKDPKSKKYRELPPGLSLLPVDEFIQRYTDHGDGNLYHGTPKLDVLLSMIRNGMVVSSDRQGSATFGRGAYTTGSYSEASEYVETDGFVIQIPIKKELHPRILNLDDTNVGDSPVLKEIRREAEAQHRDLHEYLAHEYGVDIIVREHVLIQNAAVLKTPKKLKDLIDLSASEAKRIMANLQQDLSEESLGKVKNFISYSHLADALQIHGAEIPPTWAQSLLSNLQEKRDDSSKANSIKLLAILYPDDSKVHHAIAGELKDADPKVRVAVIRTLLDLKLIDLPTLVEMLKDPDPLVLRAALHGLWDHIPWKHLPKDQVIPHAIATVLKCPDSEVRVTALKLLRDLKPNDPAIRDAIIGALKDPEREVRQWAILALQNMKSADDPVIHHAIAETLNDADPLVRGQAFYAFKEHKPRHPTILRAIAKTLNDADDYVRLVSLEIFREVRKISDPKTYLLILKSGHPELLEYTENDPTARAQLLRNLILESRHSSEKEKHEILSALGRLHVSKAEVALLKEKAVHESEECRAQGKTSSFGRGLNSLVEFLEKLDETTEHRDLRSAFGGK